MNFTDPAMSLFAASGGDTVKLFDVSMDPGDPCVLSHTPSPGSQVKSVKWNHTNVKYNYKDEHLASVSLSGDLIIHNLTSGARATELKDPNGQVLRVLDYSRISRHLLVTAGDDGSVHLWDTTGRNVKVSSLKQHSAPTAGTDVLPLEEPKHAKIYSHIKRNAPA